jgi:transposase
VDIITPCCAGLDVPKKSVTACVRRAGPDGRVGREVLAFGTTTAELMALADWLDARGVTRVAMESTGVYWQPVRHPLEDRFEVLLVNAHHLKQVPGRKTDVKDAEWIAQLLRYGLLQASFVPPRPVRELRDLTRQRTQLVRHKAALANRVQKVLEDCNIKPAGVASDVLGASGRAMIEAMIRGEADPARRADLAQKRLRSKLPQLREALYGRVTDHHRFLLQALMDRLRQTEDLIARFEARVEEVMAPFAAAEARLMTIPGVGRRAAEVIVAELGTDLTKFPTSGHLASWAGLCPGNDQSAGKRRGGKTTEGDAWLRATLVQAAWAATQAKGTRFNLLYQRWVKRMGKKKALVSVAHKRLVVAYEVLKQGVGYVEYGLHGQAA